MGLTICTMVPRVAVTMFVISVTGLLLGKSFAAEPVNIYTVNYPLYYFAQRIAGEQADVVFPAPEAADPAFWQPSPETVGEYQTADLILLNGAGYAKWIDKVTLPRSRLVDTSRPFAGDYLQAEEVVTHSHGPQGKHAHAGMAATTWLDFRQAAAQAESITEALIRRRPELEQVFTRNLDALKQELTALDQQMAELTANRPGVLLLASHPVYQYLARRYQLEVKSVQWEPSIMPDNVQWHELEDLLTEHPARWMIWESEPKAETVERLRSLGVDSLVFDPSGNRPQKGDFLSVMENNIQNMRKAYGDG